MELTNWTAPRNVHHLFVLQAGRLDAVNERSPHPKLTHNFIQRRLAHEEFFGGVR